MPCAGRNQAAKRSDLKEVHMSKLFRLFGSKLLNLGGAKASTLGGPVGAPEDEVSLFI